MGITYNGTTMVTVVGAKDYGTATGGTSTTLQDTTKSWSTDELAGRIIWIYGGTGVGQKRFIMSNTSDTITIQFDWDTTPDATSQYTINYNMEDVWDEDQTSGWGIMERIENHDSANRWCSFYKLKKRLTIGDGTTNTFFAGLREAIWIYDYYKVKDNAILQWGMLQRNVEDNPPYAKFDTPARGCYIIIDRYTLPDSVSYCYHVENGGIEYGYDSYIRVDFKAWDTQVGATWILDKTTLGGEVRTDTCYVRQWGATSIAESRFHHFRNMNFPESPTITSLHSYGNQNDVQVRDKTSWVFDTVLDSSSKCDIKVLFNGQVHLVDCTISYAKCCKGGLASTTTIFVHKRVYLTVVDSNADPIENAEVSLTDKDGYECMQIHRGETLDVAVGSTDTIWTVSDTSNWSADDYLAIENEIVRIVSIDSSTQITVERAQRTTQAKSHSISDTNKLETTFGHFEKLYTDSNGQVILTDRDALRIRQTDWIANGDPIPDTAFVNFNPFVLTIKKYEYTTLMASVNIEDTYKSVIIMTDDPWITKDYAGAGGINGSCA